MFSHIVPKTYLKQWLIDGSNEGIYIFKKNNIQSEGTQRNISNLTGTNFGKNNWFNLKIETCNHQIYDKLFNPVLNELLKDYTLEYKNKNINSPGLFRIVYLCHRNDLIIKRKSDSAIINVKKLNAIINKSWNDSQKHYIENFLSKNIENEWFEYLNNVINNTHDTIDYEMKKYFSLFITIQLYKDSQIINMQLNSLIPNIFKNDSSNNQNEILLDTFYEFINDYETNNLNSNNVIYKAYNNLLNQKWNFKLLKNNNSDYLTSDNPVFIDKYNGDEAIFFPLCPNMCLIMIKSKKDRTIIEIVNDIEKRLINSLIIKNSNEEIAFNNNTINKKLYH